MPYMDILQKVTELKAELDSLLPMKKEDEDRLWKKFRLEWNYNSNHIEGNTLTYGQTELLLIFDKAVGDHDFREYEEMKAHDVAIKMVRELAEDKEGLLTLDFIKELNKVILVKPFWKDAITPNGQSVRRLIKVGEYKEHPNSVRLQNGEIFHYALPVETPGLMGELIEWYRGSEKAGMHPLELAAKLHYKFVRIHPFDDGNGRVSRLLMNYILLKNGYPPVIVKKADDKSYYLALNKADVGDIDAFVEYIGKELAWSLEKNISAAKGENINEPDDLDKEISLLKNELKKFNNRTPIKKSQEVKLQIFEDSISPLFKKFLSKCTVFDELYNQTKVLFYSGSSGQYYPKEKVIDVIKNELIKPSKNLNEITLEYRYEAFKKEGFSFFDRFSFIKIHFQDYEYKISISNDDYNKSFSNYSSLSEFEIDKIVSTEIKKHTDFINQQIEKANSQNQS